MDPRNVPLPEGSIASEYSSPPTHIQTDLLVMPQALSNHEGVSVGQTYDYAELALGVPEAHSRHDQMHHSRPSEAAPLISSATMDPTFNDAAFGDLSSVAAFLSADHVLGLDFQQTSDSTMFLQSFDPSTGPAVEEPSIDARLTVLEEKVKALEAQETRHVIKAIQEEIESLRAWKIQIDFKYSKLNNIVNECLKLLQSRSDIFHPSTAGGP